jgi:hypothetical protein
VVVDAEVGVGQFAVDNEWRDDHDFGPRRFDDDRDFTGAGFTACRARA